MPRKIYTHGLTLMAALTLTISGCAKHSAVVVAPGYSKQDAINANIAVVMLDKKPDIIYRGDALKSLHEVNKNNETTHSVLIMEHFKTRLIEDIAKEVYVSGAFFTEVTQRYLVTKEAVKTAEEGITVEIPDLNTRFAFDTADAALVLFLDHVRIGTETDPYYADRAQHGLYTAAARKLIYAASFVLWDNRELKPICYGRVTSRQPIIREEATLNDWGDVSRDFTRQIFEATGFLKPAAK